MDKQLKRGSDVESGSSPPKILKSQAQDGKIIKNNRDWPRAKKFTKFFSRKTQTWIKVSINFIALNRLIIICSVIWVFRF